MLAGKNNAICLLEILREFSDTDHILSMREIQAKMQIIYGFKPDRRTIYSAAASLNDMGYDISLYEENKIGYYLRSRIFEPSEILLLTDAVYAFPFIPERQSEELIDKLQNHLSTHQRKQYGHRIIMRQNRKTDNRQVFWNIEQLNEAITAKKQISFSYLEYRLDKKLHPRREEPYIVNPYGMVYTNERYYLICNLRGYPNIGLYRVDLMRDIELTETDIDKQVKSKDEVKNAVYAFSGVPERITMYCDKGIIGDVFDKFGMDVLVSERDDERVSISFTVPPAGVKFWALQYLPYVEVVEPKWLRGEIKESIRRNHYGE